MINFDKYKNLKEDEFISHCYQQNANRDLFNDLYAEYDRGDLSVKEVVDVIGKEKINYFGYYLFTAIEVRKEAINFDSVDSLTKDKLSNEIKNIYSFKDNINSLYSKKNRNRFKA